MLLLIKYDEMKDKTKVEHNTDIMPDMRLRCHIKNRYGTIPKVTVNLRVPAS